MKTLTVQIDFQGLTRPQPKVDRLGDQSLI
jgi:hypothetical protein